MSNKNKGLAERHRYRFNGNIGTENSHFSGHSVPNMTLDKLKTGSSAVITTVGGVGALRRRLLDMGLTPKTRVQILKVAPLGDPIVLRLRGYDLTVRREDTGKIEISEVE